MDGRTGAARSLDGLRTRTRGTRRHAAGHGPARTHRRHAPAGVGSRLEKDGRTRTAGHGRTCAPTIPPSGIPGRTPRVVRRAAVGRSSGSWTRTAQRLPPTGRRFPGHGPVRVTAVVSTYRCGAAPDSHRVPVLSPGTPGTDGPHPIGGSPPRQHKMLCPAIGTSAAAPGRGDGACRTAAADQASGGAGGAGGGALAAAPRPPAKLRALSASVWNLPDAAPSFSAQSARGCWPSTALK